MKFNSPISLAARIEPTSPHDEETAHHVLTELRVDKPAWRWEAGWIKA